MAKKKEDVIVGMKFVCQILMVTPMTIYNYRQGNFKKLKTPLPFYTKPRGKRISVFFKLHEVLRWARANKIPLDPATKGM